MLSSICCGNEYSFKGVYFNYPFYSPCWSAHDFWKMDFKKWTSTKSIFGLFRTWILQATQAVKIKFEKDQKCISSKSIFRNPFFKKQVQINRGYANFVCFLFTLLIHIENLHKWVIYYYSIFPRVNISEIHGIENMIQADSLTIATISVLFSY